MTEAYLERKIKRHIKARGGLAIPIDGKGQKGVPDLAVVFEGVTIFLEVKVPGRKLSKHQEKMHSEILSRGGHVFVVTSTDEVDDVLLLYMF